MKITADCKLTDFLMLLIYGSKICKFAQMFHLLVVNVYIYFLAISEIRTARLTCTFEGWGWY